MLNFKRQSRGGQPCLCSGLDCDGNTPDIYCVIMKQKEHYNKIEVSIMTNEVKELLEKWKALPEDRKKNAPKEIKFAVDQLAHDIGTVHMIKSLADFIENSGDNDSDEVIEDDIEDED